MVALAAAAFLYYWFLTDRGREPLPLGKGTVTVVPEGSRTVTLYFADANHAMLVGETRQVAIGRGLMSLPRLLILDEPSLGLAPMLVAEVFQVIQKINQEGVAILLVEQNAHQSLKISNRAYLLENGSIAMEGKASELLETDYIRESYLGI